MPSVVWPAAEARAAVLAFLDGCPSWLLVPGEGFDGIIVDLPNALCPGDVRAVSWLVAGVPGVPWPLLRLCALPRDRVKALRLAQALQARGAVAASPEHLEEQLAASRVILLAPSAPPSLEALAAIGRWLNAGGPPPP